METQTHHGQPYAICSRCGSMFRVKNLCDNLEPEISAVCRNCRRAEREAAQDRINRAAYQERERLSMERVSRTVDPETGNIIEWRR